MDASHQPNADNDLDLSDLDPSTRALIQSMDSQMKMNQLMMKSQLEAQMQSHQLLVATLVSQVRGSKRESTSINGAFVNQELKPNMPGEESNPIQIDDDDEIKQEPVNEELNATAVVSASSDVEQNIPTQQNIPAPANNQQKCIRCKKGQVVERQRCKTCLKKLKETNSKVRGTENMIDLVKRRHEKTDKRVSFASSNPEVVTIQSTSSSSTAKSKTKASTAQATPTHTVNESAVQATSTTQSGKRKRGRPAGTPAGTPVSAQAAVQPPAKRGRKASTDKGNCTNCKIKPSLCRKLCSRCYSKWYVKSKQEGTFVAMKTYPPNRRSSKKAQEAVVEVQMQHDDDQSSDTTDPSYVEDEEHELLTLDDTPPETPNDQVQHLHTQKASQVVIDLETQKVQLVETAVRKTTQVICNNCRSVLKDLTKNRPLKTRFCKACYQSLTKEEINKLRICKGCHLFRLLKGNGKCGECLEPQVEQGMSNGGTSPKWELLK